MKNKMMLPRELEKYRETIESTLKESIIIKPVKRRTTLIESKFSGNPYFPKNMEYPKDENDQPMKLLAQINFSEIPSLDLFPKEGLLQFFISAYDDTYGADFDNETNQKNFRIIYHESTNDKDFIEDFSFLPSNKECDFPVEIEAAMSFDLTKQPISIDVLGFDFIEENIPLEQKIIHHSCYDLYELYFEYFSGDGHRIAGYPYFTQVDPRMYAEKYKDYRVLLLQIDSDDDINSMFGDVGVANFFITEEDLKKKDFSKVIYNWDCS